MYNILEQAKLDENGCVEHGFPIKHSMYSLK